MAKDPALLWYPGDWTQGTQLFTFEEKGAYMTLLMIQFENEALSMDDIKHVLGSKFDSIWARICHKFKQDADGRYFQWRIREEKIKRVKFTESRKKNLMKPHMDAHMENENRNRIKDILNPTNNGEASENLHPKAGQKDTTEKEDKKDLRLPPTQLIQSASHWRGRLTEQHKMAFRRTILAKFPNTPEDTINYTMFMYLDWWDLKHPDGNNFKVFTSWFSYYIEQTTQLPKTPDKIKML